MGGFGAFLLMDAESFFSTQQPVWLLVNGHASQLTPDLIDLASKKRCYSFLSTSSHNTCVTTLVLKTSSTYLCVPFVL